MAETKKSIEERVKDIIIKKLDLTPEQVGKLESRFVDDLGADSLDVVELIMAFEEEFGGDITDEEAEKLHTIGDTILYITEKEKKKALAP